MNETMITASELCALLTDTNAMKEGETYRVNGEIKLDSDNAVYSSNGATVIAENGIEIIGCNVSFYKCKIISDNGIISYGDSFSVEDCEIVSKSCSIQSNGKNFIAKSNKITTDKEGVGICLSDGSVNSLIAQNTFYTSKCSVSVDNAVNCVVILNNAAFIKGDGCKNLYVIKNTANKIELNNNKYLICDGNTVEAISSHANSETNGDNIQDITVRCEYGANDELLPHINKELFIGMPRQTTVRDISINKKVSLAEYITSSSEQHDIVIVPPGAYTVYGSFTIGEEQSNTEIYAYGVYAEAPYLGQIMHVNGAKNVGIYGLTFGYASAVSGQVQVVELLGDNKLTAVNTAGFDAGFGKTDPSKYNIGNTYLYHHNDNRTWGSFLNAYYVDDHGDGTYTFTLADPFGTYERLKVGDIFTCRMAGSSSQTVLSHNAVNVSYKDVTVFGYGAGTAFRTKDGCDGVSFERYCLTNGAPYVIDKEAYDRYKAWEEKYGIDLEVFIDECGRYRGGAPRIGGIGGMEVENAKTGVNLTSCLIENIVDDGSNQRGSSGRLAGIKKNTDGTYTVYYKGSLCSVYHQAVFSRTAHNTGKSEFSPLCCPPVKKGDKLFAYASNGAVLFDNATALEDAYELIGSDEHLAHTDTDGDGRCDICGAALNQGNTKEPSVNNTFHPEDGSVTFNVANTLPEGPRMLDYTTYIYAVKIAADDGVDMGALEGYDLLSNDYDSKTQVFFDNVGKNCASFTFDNVKVQNNVARGVLLKTRGIVIKNSTFRGQALQGIIIGRETNWGESSIPRNILIEDCIFDNTSYSYKNIGKSVAYAQINIQGLGEVNKNITLHDNFACANITIHHNKFLNTTNGHIIHASGAKGVKITDNIFEEHEGDGIAVYLNGCIDVNIARNKYSERLRKAIDEKEYDKAFILYKYKDLTIEGEALQDSNENPPA